MYIGGVGFFWFVFIFCFFLEGRRGKVWRREKSIKVIRHLEVV